VNNAMPGLNAVSTLIGKQQQEDASDIQGYRSGSKNFYDALFKLESENRKIKGQNAKGTVDMLKLIQEEEKNQQDKYFGKDVIRGEDGKGWGVAFDSKTGKPTVNPILDDQGNQINLPEPASDESLRFRKNEAGNQKLDTWTKEWRRNHSLIGALRDKKLDQDGFEKVVTNLYQSNPDLALALAGKSVDEAIKALEDNQVQLEKQISPMNSKFDAVYTKRQDSKVKLNGGNGIKLKKLPRQ
jgi:hypothetical protein